MVKIYQRIALCLVFMLVFQSLAAAGFSGCRHTGKSGRAMHDMISHEQILHQQHDACNADKPARKSGCNCECYCAGVCMHGCHGQLLITSIVIIIPDVISNVLSIEVNAAVPGFSFPLLRPPSLLNRYFNVIG